MTLPLTGSCRVHGSNQNLALKYRLGVQAQSSHTDTYNSIRRNFGGEDVKLLRIDEGRLQVHELERARASIRVVARLSTQPYISKA